MSSTLVENAQQFYDSVSQYFSATRKWLWPEMLPYINRIRKNDTVLDIGCGNGRLLNGITCSISYTGVDFSKMLLVQAKKLHPNTIFLHGNILKSKTWIELPKARVVFCVAVLHHIPHKDLEGLVKNIYLKLEKSGFAYISTWNLWQKKYLKYHFSWQSLLLKIKERDFRYVMIPFAGSSMRMCVAYLKSDVRRLGYDFENIFISGINRYLSGRNIVWVLKKS